MELSSETSAAALSESLTLYLGRPVAVVATGACFDTAHRLAASLRLCGEAFDARPTLCPAEESGRWAVVVPAPEYRRAVRAARAIAAPVDRPAVRVARRTSRLHKSPGAALHAWMGAVGIPSGEHRAVASRALAREVGSFNALSPDDCATVRAAVQPEEAR